MGFRVGSAGCDHLASLWSLLSLFRHVATGHQYRDDGRHLLVVFLIQNTQNRDARAIHLKLDEIIKAMDHAQNEMIDIEHLSDEELQKLANKYQRVRQECENRTTKRK